MRRDPAFLCGNKRICAQRVKRRVEQSSTKNLSPRNSASYSAKLCGFLFFPVFDTGIPKINMFLTQITDIQYLTFFIKMSRKQVFFETVQNFIITVFCVD